MVGLSIAHKASRRSMPCTLLWKETISCIDCLHVSRRDLIARAHGGAQIVSSWVSYCTISAVLITMECFKSAVHDIPPGASRSSSLGLCVFGVFHRQSYQRNAIIVIVAHNSEAQCPSSSSPGHPRQVFHGTSTCTGWYWAASKFSRVAWTVYSTTVPKCRLHLPTRGP
ncbi:hypothetical protein BX600DRAFT_249369 [Xylariales sp. PMI_506]|nr:hypothetical protein BX600DRAFT_249369 [Xylariales sp. PMI_506]